MTMEVYPNCFDTKIVNQTHLPYWHTDRHWKPANEQLFLLSTLPLHAPESGSDQERDRSARTTGADEHAWRHSGDGDAESVKCSRRGKK